MKREPICTQPAACLGKSRLGQEPVRTIRSSFWAGIRIYPSIPLTGACKARRIKPFSSLIVRRQPAFSGHWLFSACGERWQHRTCSILPGWNREERAGRRQRTVCVLSDKAKQSPGVHLKAGQRYETSCIAGSRKYSAHRRILLHRQGQGNSRSHSYSTGEPAFLPCGTGNMSSRGFSL